MTPSITTFSPEAHEEDLSARQEEMDQLLDGLNDERDKLEDQPNMTQVALRAPEDCPSPSSYLNDVSDSKVDGPKALAREVSQIAELNSPGIESTDILDDSNYERDKYSYLVIWSCHRLIGSRISRHENC